MANFIQVTPFIYTTSLDEALRFFTDILGFTVNYRVPGYAYVQRETVAFRIWEQHGENAPTGNRRFAHYIDVRDVDALFAELKPALETLPTGDVFGPVNQTWNQREFMVLAPDGNLIVFGQPIQSATASPSD